MLSARKFFRLNFFLLHITSNKKFLTIKFLIAPATPSFLDPLWFIYSDYIHPIYISILLFPTFRMASNPTSAILQSLSREQLCTILDLASEMDLDMFFDNWQIRASFQVFTNFAIRNLETVVMTDLMDGRIVFGAMVMKGNEDTVD